MSSRKMIALFVTTISVLSLASASRAAVISIDFNESAVKGVGPSTTATATGNPTGTFGGMGATELWNALNLGPDSSSQNPPVAAQLPLLQSGGTPTGVAFTVTTGSTYFIGAFQPSDPLRNEEMIIFGGGSENWSITGLIPGNVYDLRFYGNLNGLDASSPGYTVVGGTVTTTGTNTDRQALAVTATGGVISGTAFQNGPNGEWTGLQIRGTFVADTVPEPSTFVLAALGLAGLGIVALRRRRVSDC